MKSSIEVGFVLAALVAASVYAAPVNQAVVFGSDTPSAAAAIAGLKQYNVPYVSYDTAASVASPTLPLYDTTSTANFSMIILGSGILAFSASQWTQLFDYQETLGARLVALYDEPGKGASAAYTSGAALTTGAFNASPASAVASSLCGLPAAYSAAVDTAALGWVYPATAVNATAVSPVLTFDTTPSTLAAAVYSFSANREQLSFFYQIAEWQYPAAGSISSYTVSILVSWVSKGTYGFVQPAVITGPPANQAVVFGSDTPSAEAAIAGLVANKIPYIAYTTASSVGFSTLPLAAGTFANFSMIILGSGIIGFSTAQWTQIHEYQELFDVRLVSLYDEPGKGASASYTSGSLVTSGAFTVSPTNVIASTNASLPVSYSVPVDTAALGWIYPATVLNAAAVTPVLSFSTTPSSVAAAVYSFSAKREQLSFFFQTAGWQASTTGSISNYTDAILISWVSKGLYGYVAPTVPVVTGPPVNQAVVFGNEFASASAAINGLRAYKIPFIEYDSTTSASFATLPLTANNVANFSMIILGSGAIGFSAAQWKQLYEYQSLFNVRLVSLYDVPGSGASASYTSTSGSANGVFTVSPLSAVGSADAGFPSSFTAVLDTAKYGGIYPANIVNTTAVTPILSFKSASNVISTAAAVYSFSATQQQLSFFYQIAGWDTSSQSATLSTYTVDVLISWVSKGLYTKALAPVVPHAVQVQTRALILSSGDNTEEYAQSTFQSYGLAYDTVVIAAADVSTNPLNLEVTPNVLGRYSVIVLANGQMLAGFTNGSYLSTLTPTQWSQLHNYQQYYGVRLVALNDAPNAASYAGKLTGYNGLTGCSSATLSVAPASSVFTDPAGLKSSWSLAAGDDIPNGSCNFPATAVDATAVTPVLNFVSSGIAAAVIDFGRNQQQMSFFLPCGSWSIACTTVGNIWFQWATRGTYTGLRRIYFTPQIDDVFLNTDGNNELGQPVAFRTSQADIQGLINWMPEINSRLPAGSNITIEMAYNGNGIMEYISKQNLANYHIDFDPDLTDAPLNWKKPLGTGKTLWPAGANHNWNKSILAKDPIYNFFSAPGNLTSVTSKFLWCSHTFTHEILNNNTYSDTINEVSFNFHLAELWGLDGQPFWSNKSMVTPGISGIFNGDALKALLDFGITGAVGDSSRPSLWNTERPFWWPMTTTVEKNGYAGFTVVPRQSLNIYFNTTNQEYNTILYNNIYGTNKTFAEIMAIEVKRTLRFLPLLSWQPAMFHQANLRNADLPVVSFGSASGKWSLMQQWVEHVFGSLAQITNWPILSLSQDVLTQKFINRQIYETADVNVVQLWNVTAAGVTSSGFSVSAAKSCIAPVTLPHSVTVGDIISLPAGATTEQVGSVDSVTVWIPLTAGAAPVSVVFATKSV